MKFSLKETKRSLGRVAKKAISNLPESIKGPLIRNLIKVDKSAIGHVEVKLCETIDEFEQVFRLLRKNYIAQGFVKPADPLAMNKYQVARGSSVIIAKVGLKVIGTLTLVNKSGLGLPLERAFNIDQEISEGEVIYELTSLTVDSDYRRKDGFNCLFPLMKFMYQYAKSQLKMDKLFIACFPRDVDFYVHILFFDKMKSNGYVADYLGAPAECLHLNLNTAEERFLKGYYHKSGPRNLYQYFIDQTEKKFDFTGRRGVFSKGHYEYFSKKGYELNLSSKQEEEYFASFLGTEEKLRIIS